jgi:DNA-binding NarL/FixJ family response regulator
VEEQVVDLAPCRRLVDAEYLTPVAAERVRVLIADDQRLFAEALEAILSTDGRIAVVGRASDGAAGLGVTRDEQPDLGQMDNAMPRNDGIAATRAIGTEVPGTRVIVLTGSNAPHDVSRARDAGAAGYVTKDQIAGDLVRAILDAAGR